MHKTDLRYFEIYRQELIAALFHILCTMTKQLRRTQLDEHKMISKTSDDSELNGRQWRYAGSGQDTLRISAACIRRFFGAN